jgi:cyanate permease
MKQSLLLALQVASHLAYMVLVPLLVFGGAGLWLDQRQATTPLYLLLGVGIAFILTMLWIKKQSKRITAAIFKEK